MIRGSREPESLLIETKKMDSLKLLKSPKLSEIESLVLFSHLMMFFLGVLFVSTSYRFPIILHRPFNQAILLKDSISISNSL